MCCVVKCRSMSYKCTWCMKKVSYLLIKRLSRAGLRSSCFCLSFGFFAEFMSQRRYSCLIWPISMYTFRVTAAKMTVRCVWWWFTLKERLKPCAGFIHILTTVHDSCEHDLHIYVPQLNAAKHSCVFSEAGKKISTQDMSIIIWMFAHKTNMFVFITIPTRQNPRMDDSQP